MTRFSIIHLKQHQYRGIGLRAMGEPSQLGLWPNERIFRTPAIDSLEGSAAGGVLPPS